MEVLEGQTGVCKWNILWWGRWPMRGGVFPKAHPCVTSPGAAGLERFRSLGYWASCFPEGDGVTFTLPESKAREDVRKDVEECFGFEAVESESSEEKEWARLSLAGKVGQ